jgi:predicted alpha/beta superfamily hydrolase
MKIKYALLLAVSMSFHNLAISQEERIGSATLIENSAPANFQRLTFQSGILGQDRHMNISLPDNFDLSSPEHTYPVLLLLEDEFFLMVSGVVKHLSSIERMPETIVVSLQDEVPVPELFTNGSDFWPKDWVQLPFGENPDPMTRHLAEELMPYLKTHFRANGFNMVMGLSGTAMYAVHTYFNTPDLFDAHIALASGDILGMGYRQGERFIELFEEDARQFPDRNRILYVCSADADAESAPMIKSNLEALEAKLAPFRADHLRFIAKLYPIEGHYDVALPALGEALQLIFPEARWFAKYRAMIGEPGNAMENIDDHFSKLSARYGFKILPRAERWNSVNSLSWIGRDLLRNDKPEEAVEVFERWVAYKPESVEALKELAKGYEAKGEPARALGAIEKAFKLVDGTNADEGDEFTAHINRLKSLIVRE